MCKLIKVTIHSREPNTGSGMYKLGLKTILSYTHGFKKNSCMILIIVIQFQSRVVSDIFIPRAKRKIIGKQSNLKNHSFVLHFHFLSADSGKNRRRPKSNFGLKNCHGQDTPNIGQNVQREATYIGTLVHHT